VAIKVTIIGAGSLGFTRMLVNDILSVPEFADTHFAMTDINRRNLDMVAQLTRRDIRFNRLPARVTATVHRRRALKDADYVLNVARIGGLEAFEMDIDLPLKYGVDQCVGDTLCMGGIMYGQRNAPAILDFCKDIREVAKPGALFLNYANPNAMNTWIAEKYGKVRTVGLCHGVQAGRSQIADVIRLLVNKGRKPGSRSYKDVKTSDIKISAVGINHQTWYVKVGYAGEDWTGRLLEGFEKHPVYSKTEKVRMDLMRRFGYFTTESNGHVSEYVPWYRKRTGNIRKWISMKSWIDGETGGYLRVCREGWDRFKKDFPTLLAAEPKKIGRRGLEHGSYIIEALETGRRYRGHFNVRNKGCVSNLPDDAIVEVPCYATGNGIRVPGAGRLPPGCAAVCNASISVQRLAVEAAVNGDVMLLKQAAMMDPLTGAVCDPLEIDQMVDEMLVAQARWLPQYAKEIPRAGRRLANAKRLGTRKGRGAARREQQ
jgi:alpha-galactosidase